MKLKAKLEFDMPAIEELVKEYLHGQGYSLESVEWADETLVAQVHPLTDGELKDVPAVYTSAERAVDELQGFVREKFAALYALSSATADDVGKILKQSKKSAKAKKKIKYDPTKTYNRGPVPTQLDSSKETMKKETEPSPLYALDTDKHGITQAAQEMSFADATKVTDDAPSATDVFASERNANFVKLKQQLAVEAALDDDYDMRDRLHNESTEFPG